MENFWLDDNSCVLQVTTEQITQSLQIMGKMELTKRVPGVFTLHLNVFPSKIDMLFLNESVLVLSDYVEKKNQHKYFCSASLFIIYVVVCVCSLEKPKCNLRRGFFTSLIFHEYVQKKHGDV